MKIFFALSFLVLTCFAANAQEKSKDQKEIEQTVLSFFEAISVFDFGKMKSYTKDIQIIEYGEVWDLNILIDALKPMVGKGVIRINTLKFLKTEIYQNTADMIYNNTADFVENSGRKNRVEWLESVVMIKEKGKWNITLLHSTALPAAK